MDREQVLAIIDAAYAARLAHDGEALKRFWAEGAVFELVGEAALLEAFPGSTGPSPGQQTVEEIMALVKMIAVERLDAVVEGHRAATLSRARVSFAGREPFETLLYDLWELDDEGKVSVLRQFADTAKVASEMRAVARLSAGDPPGDFLI